MGPPAVPCPVKGRPGQWDSGSCLEVRGRGEKNLEDPSQPGSQEQPPTARGPGPNAHVCSLSAEDQLPPGFPSIDMGPQLKVVEKARTATMLCAAGGNPDPEISWFKDFLPVDPTTSNGRIKQLRSGE